MKIIEIDVFDYAGEILKGLKSGVLLTTKHEDRVNTMSISWGQIGIEWHKPIFTTFVRTGRFTHKMLEKSQEFCINIPIDSNVKKIIHYCGTKSGRQHDKIKDLNLNLYPGNIIATPGIVELPLTLECKVIYSQMQNEDQIPDYVKNTFYSSEDKNTDPKDLLYHQMFFGEIVGAHIISD